MISLAPAIVAEVALRREAVREEGFRPDLSGDLKYLIRWEALVTEKFIV
jgi:hypothetical protein